MIISIFGKDGSGKTTMATHLANYLSKQNKFIGIISTETRYGSLQRNMGVSIDEKQSLLQAILNPSAASSCFSKVTDNMYILTMSDETTIKDYDTATALLGSQNRQSEEQIKRMQDFIDSVEDVFDILIIDTTDRITDVLTYTFLSKSDKILNIIQSNLDGIAYENAHAMFNELKIFQEKKINILNKHFEKIINEATIEELLKQKISLSIPYNEDFVFHFAQGTINKKMLKYLKQVEELIFDEKIKDKREAFSFFKRKKKEK